MRFKFWGFLRYDSSFTFLGGESFVVDFWVRLLELKEEEMHFYCSVCVHQTHKDILLYLYINMEDRTLGCPPDMRPQGPEWIPMLKLIFGLELYPLNQSKEQGLAQK